MPDTDGLIFRDFDPSKHVADSLDQAEFVAGDTPTNTHKLSLQVEQLKVQIDQARSLRRIADSLELFAEMADNVLSEPLQVQRVK